MILALSLLAAPAGAAPPAVTSPLGRAFSRAAQEQGVPVELLYALAYEASGLHDHPDASAWGGRTMFDFVESDETGGPALERASALITADPNKVIADWRLAARAAAALLADEARETNGGVLPSVRDLDAWQPAVAAFSGRDEPNLQGLYVEAVYAALADGFSADGPQGAVVVAPQAVTVDRGPAPPPASTDYSGAAAWVPACTDNYSDYSRGSGDIDMIVIHTVQGSYSGCSSWFANCSAQASAHYVVRSSDGQVTQMVREADVAWHAGNWDYNTRSVGIEHEGYIDDCSYYTDALYKGSAALALDIATRQGVSLDRSHIIGHSEVPDPDGSGYGGSGHHTDPGTCWDWDYYMSLLTGGTSSSGGEIIGYVRENDIYNTAGNLVGASVWIAETGDTTTVGSDGLYRFEDVPYGNYTIHATMSGYGEGTCDSALSGSQDWCSIALTPGSGGGEDSGGGTEDTGSGDSGAVDTGGAGNGGSDVPAELRPGTPTPLAEVGGSGTCDQGAGAPLALGLAAAALAATRRRARR